MLRYCNFISCLVLIIHCISSEASPVQKRVDNDIAAGNPVVVHVSVALADNKHQNIVPVPQSIGNGRDASKNLYWVHATD